jgi:hypothetical protein
LALLESTPYSFARSFGLKKQEAYRGLTRMVFYGLSPATQFRERAGGKDKMLKAQSLSPFQASGRSDNDDPVCGLETMTAVGNFFQDTI